MNLNGRLSYTGNVKGSLGASLVANVEANPAGAASEILTKIRVGDTIYKIPSGGGGGGTSDYNALNNKPKVNNVTLSGDMTLADLGIQPAITFPGDNSKYLDGDGNFSIPLLNFSSNEIVIGNWLDGKPLYLKAHNINSLPNSSAVNYSLGINNIDTVVLLECVAQNASVALPLFYNAGNDNNSKIQIHMVDKSNGTISINTFNDNRSSLSGSVFILFTKTTD